MILKQEDLKVLITKELNILSVSQKLNLIQTYVYEKKGKDIGDIQLPQNQQILLPELIALGVHPVINDYKMADYLCYCSLLYYKDKFKKDV